ncbi:MAG: chalcone isomerase family protein [Candidatus Competibacteraceae bacterium]
MSYNLNSPISRRRLLGLLAAWPLASLANTLPESPITGLRRWGSGELRRFGFLIYEATLWAGDDPTRPPLALQLTYQRHIQGQALVEASVAEMRKLGVTEKAQLERWSMALARIFPNVRPGDHLFGLYLPEGAHFHQGGRWLGSIQEPAFARAFFGIWLDERTSAPELRAALLQNPAR